MRRREVEERRHGGGMRVTEKEKSKNLHPFGFCLHVLFLLGLSPPFPLSPSGFSSLLLLPLPPSGFLLSLSLSLSPSCSLSFSWVRAFHCVAIWG